MSQVAVDVVINNEYDLKAIKNEEERDGDPLASENDVPDSFAVNSENSCLKIDSDFNALKNLRIELRSPLISIVPVQHNAGQVFFRCGVCRKTDDIFHNIEEVVCHSLTHHRWIYSCKLCLVTLRSSSKVLEHAEEHFNKNPPNRQSTENKPTCDVRCSPNHSEEGLYENLDEGFSPIEVKCELTDGTGEKADKKFHCNFCEKYFYKRFDLKIHLRTHTLEKPFQCDVCKKSFAQKSALRRHLYTHTGERPFLCTFCGRAFSQPGILKIHLLRTHTVEAKYKIDDLKKFVCTFCDKKFYKPFDLKIHVRVHTNEKPYNCQFCPKAFAQKGGLRKHVYTHKTSGERPHKCPYCARSYVQSFDLQNHMLKHTGEQPYKCPSCNKGFASKGNLERHKAVHTGEKRFACDRCGKEFSQFCSLADHINVHTGAKPYACSQCSKSFANRSTLVKHVRAIHEGKRQSKKKVKLYDPTGP